jgi:branched-chain amino acid transport system ATP-binding protein
MNMPQEAGPPQSQPQSQSPQPQPPPTLEIRNLSVGYGQVSVARGLNLTVRPGSVVTLLGRNGAGKTTTLHTVAGIIPPLGGEVLVDGAAVSGPLHQRVRRQGIGLVTEERAIIRRLSVIDNLRLGRGTADLAFELFPELATLRKRTAGLLSGGEQQMLVLGRCLAARPRLLLVDELSFGLAPMIVRRLLDALRLIATEHNVAILLVEQHPSLALSAADYGYVLARGEIRLSGPADQLRGQLHEIERSYLSEHGAADDADAPLSATQSAVPPMTPPAVPPAAAEELAGPADG